MLQVKKNNSKGVKGASSRLPPQTIPVLKNCSGLAFRTPQALEILKKTAEYYIVEVHDTDSMLNTDDVLPFHNQTHQKAGDSVKTTGAGFANFADQNGHKGLTKIGPALLKESFEKNLDFRKISESIGIRPGEGYMCIVPDRFKCQQQGKVPNSGRPKQVSSIIQKSCMKKGSLHCDLREQNGVHQFAILLNVGGVSRHMVITDLTKLDDERVRFGQCMRVAKQQCSAPRVDASLQNRSWLHNVDAAGMVFGRLSQAQLLMVSGTCTGVASHVRLQLLSTAQEAMADRHMRTYELIHYVQQTKTGMFSDFNLDEKLLIKAVLRAVEIPPGSALVFQQACPHGLTASTTSEDPDANSLTFYFGLKMSEDRDLLERVRDGFVDLFASGGQHSYQKRHGRNGLQDARINAEHTQKLLPCLFEQYNIPPIDGGKGGISARHLLPTVERFLTDVRAARENPQLFEPGMDCRHLDIDNVLTSRKDLEEAMEIIKIC